jgi:hypothetical protein
MQLIKSGSSEGVWFEFVDEAKPIRSPEERSKPKEGETPNACFKIRRIPTGLQKEAFFRHFGRKTEVRRKGGAVISDTDMEASTKHNAELAQYALLDTFDAEVPADVLPLLGGKPGEMVTLDGKLTPEVRAALLGELPGLAVWIVGRADSLTARAAEEETELGKTS